MSKDTSGIKKRSTYILPSISIFLVLVIIGFVIFFITKYNADTPVFEKPFSLNTANIEKIVFSKGDKYSINEITDTKTVAEITDILNNFTLIRAEQVSDSVGYTYGIRITVNGQENFCTFTENGITVDNVYYYGTEGCLKTLADFVNN